MTRKLVIAGLSLTGAGLALMGYLDPVVRILIFGPTAANAGTALRVATGIGTSASRNMTSVAGTTPLLDVVTVIALAAAVVGLLLTVAGVLSAGKGLPKASAPTPAA